MHPNGNAWHAASWMQLGGWRAGNVMGHGQQTGGEKSVKGQGRRSKESQEVPEQHPKAATNHGDQQHPVESFLLSNAPILFKGTYSSGF